MVSLETWQCCWLFHENQAQKPSRVLSPIGQRSWDASWRWNTWAWREERAQAASECHNLEAIENTGGEVHVAITASCNISENAYTDDFRKEGDVMVQMAVHSLLFPEKAEVYDVWKNTSDKYILKGILSSVTSCSPDKEFLLSSALLRKTGSLESMRRLCQQGLLQYCHGWLKCKDTASQGYFWEPRMLWGCDMLSWSTEHLRALTGFSCLNSSSEAQRVSKPLKYNKQGKCLTCVFSSNYETVSQNSRIFLVKLVKYSLSKPILILTLLLGLWWGVM